ncbi:ATP-binding protein [Caulobacter segnis]|uniref:hybrid sensor histidine kinase/response regulator n=1 Tax=Caulobacter segnis TaxID=88688 RepID=UPI00285971B8|nr:ATP-binding protein [Caulobacter segnis]MDR6626959.1 signal transduction histidine kinase/CheY-like chemotaxis protein [Caulobacter segnis]
MPVRSGLPLNLGRPKGALLVLAFGVAVFALATLSIELPRRPGHSSPVWMPNALIATALLRTSRDQWPMLLATAGVACWGAAVALGAAMGLALGLTAANLIECLLCAVVLLKLVGPDLSVGRPRHLAFVVAASLGATVVSGGLAALVFWVLRGGDHLGLRAVSWIAGNALGLLTLVPCLLALSRARELLKERPVTRGGWLALAALTITSIAVFAQSRYPLLFVIPPALALLALELEVLGAALGVIIVGAVAVCFTGAGSGPITLVQGDLTERALFLQLFLGVSILSSLPLASSSAQRRRLQAKAEEAAHVKADFLANMSHELRTPLTAVLGFAQLVERQPELSPETRAYVQRVTSAGKALRATINDILDFSKLEAGQADIKPQPMSVAELTREAVEMFAAQAREKGVVLRLADLSKLPPLIEADPDRLRQVLLNLIGNAVKFTEIGEIAVQADVDPRAGHIVFEVSDTGPGMSADQSKRLFQRFSQVDAGAARKHGGTGLGLAICKGLVEAMGGTIGVDSRPGEGSRFWFTIPAIPAEPASEPATPTEVISLPEDCRVLVVDDNTANRQLVRAILTPFGAVLTEAADGDEAIEAAEAKPFDIILMDLRMPRMDGRTATARIRAGPGVNRRKPILAFSADASAPIADPLFSGHVNKPMTASGLVQAMSQAIANGRAA